MSNDTVDNAAPKRKRTTRAKKTDTPKSDTAPKKRGRKPKGGKVVKYPHMMRMSLFLPPMSYSI